MFLRSRKSLKKLSIVAIALMPLGCVTTVIAPAGASNLTPIAQFLFLGSSPGYDSVNNLFLHQQGSAPSTSSCDLPDKLSFGGCVNLSGNTYFASTQPSGSWPNLPTGNNPYTISAWVKFNGEFNGDSRSGIVGWGNNATAQGNNLRENGNCYSIWNYWYARDAGGSSNVNMCVASWHSVIATYNGTDGANRQIYIDGQLVTTYADFGQNSAANTNFVLGKTTDDVPMNGSLADVQIFSQHFDQSDVTGIFSNPADYEFSGTTTGHQANFEAGGATGTPPSSISTNTEFTIPSGSGLSKPGFTFTGWTDGGTYYQPGSNYTSGSFHDITFTATWFPKSLTVETLTPDGGYLNSVTCSSSANCVGVGATYGNTNNPIVWTGDPSKWTVANANIIDLTSLGGGHLNSVTCSSSTNCVGVGAIYGNPQNPIIYSFIAPSFGTPWGFASEVITAPTPDAPTNLSVSTPRSGGIITLSWSPDGDNGSGPITSYVCSSGASVTITVTSNTCTFTNKSLTITNNAASLSVVAVNDSGTSDPAILPVQWASPPTTTTTPVATTKTITCHKGSKTKKVTGATPVCPSGWKK